MELLDGLLGGREEDLHDLVGRYEEGSPFEGYSDEEAAGHYQAVEGQLSPEEYEHASRQAVSWLSSDEREQLGQHLYRQAQEQGVDVGGFGGSFSDPSALAGLMGGLNRQQPGLLGNMLGGGGGGGLGGMLGGGGGGGLGGMLGGGGGGGLGGMLGGGGNPLGKAVMGGIAAMALKQVLGRR